MCSLIPHAGILGDNLMLKTLFITVNYHKDDLTIALLKNMSRLGCAEQFDFVIADNTPSRTGEETLERFVEKFSSFPVKLIKTGGNSGYFGADRFALYVLGDFSKDYHAVIIANNDIEIKDRLFLMKLDSFSY